MEKSQTVVLNGKKITVRKMPLRQFAEVLKLLKELPKQFGSLDSISNDEAIARLPFIIGESLPELAAVVSVASGVDKDEILDEYGLDDISELLIVIKQVNQLDKVVSNVKKLMARQNNNKVKTGSSEQ
jgi:hypothetical protein